ncbi:hypothetical protein KSP39_PZI013306 [Platanthera zijinensis]|uniref:Uncharacterized protein n=1 Tax=Platanthera zijinensis TaxID=2320716 RepID=A0AAP0BDW4_9ASPA
MSSFPTGRQFLFPQIHEEGRSQLILPKNRKRSAMPGRGDGKRNCSEERDWGSQCFSTPNESLLPLRGLALGRCPTSQYRVTDSLSSRCFA